jgi:hypothetical protein
MSNINGADFATFVSLIFYRTLKFRYLVFDTVLPGYPYGCQLKYMKVLTNVFQQMV